MQRSTGQYYRTRAGEEEVSAFIPEPLPPTNPPLVAASVEQPLQQAVLAIAKLNLAGAMVPSVNRFIYSFVRKEAVISSQIEGTEATLIDLLNYEASGKAGAAEEAEVEEVCNYLDAVTFARKEIRNDRGLPLSTRLLNEAHKRLMKGVGGADKSSGDVRTSQNWIGGTRPGNAIYVPPPPHALGTVLGDFEKYMHAKDDLHPLIRAGLLHVQFETIHPYLDGNGRIGRLLITLLLEHWKILSRPLLYLSVFFKRHRAEYYRLLNAVRTEGDFEGWIEFFLEGVREVSEEAVMATRDLFQLVTTDRTKVLRAKSTSVMAARLFETLPENPVVTVARAVKLLKTTKPTATKAIEALMKAKVLKETTGRRRSRGCRGEERRDGKTGQTGYRKP